MSIDLLQKLINEEVELATETKYYVCYETKNGHKAMYKAKPFFNKDEAEKYVARLNQHAETQSFDNKALNGVKFFLLGPTDLTPFQVNVQFGNY